jgi:hypothetical protein
VFILTLQAAFATTRALLQISIKEHIQFAAITVTTLLVIRSQARSALSFFRAGGAFIRAALALLTVQVLVFSTALAAVFIVVFAEACLTGDAVIVHVARFAARAAVDTLFSVYVVIAAWFAIFRLTDAPYQFIIVVTFFARDEVLTLLAPRLATFTGLITYEFPFGAARPVLRRAKGIFIRTFFDYGDGG